MSEEVWKDVADYEGYYQASTYGQVRSVSRWVEHYSHTGTLTMMLRNGQLLCCTTGPKARGYVTIRLCKNGKY